MSLDPFPLPVFYGAAIGIHGVKKKSSMKFVKTGLSIPNFTTFFLFDAEFIILKNVSVILKRVLP